MDTSQEGAYLSANGVEIYYREVGQGRPLVLVHGATDTHQLWDPYLEAFSADYRVVAPDSRGHGRTLNPTRQLSYRLLADDLAGLVRGLGLEEPLIFGYSDGGQAVLDFALRYPGLAGALAVGGVWFRFSEEYRAAITRAGFVGPGKIDYQVYQAGAPPDWEERLRQAHHDPDPDYPHLLLEGLSRLWWTPLGYTPDDLGRITEPCLVLIGEMDEMIPLAEARELAELIPGAELCVVPGASHTGVFQARGIFPNAVIDYFLCRGG